MGMSDEQREEQFDRYLARCEVTKEILEFLKENPMSFAQLVDYARHNKKKEWQRAIRSRGCWWISRYCKGVYYGERNSRKS